MKKIVLLFVIFASVYLVADGGGPIPTCPPTICKPSPTNPPQPKLVLELKEPKIELSDGGRIPMCNPYSKFCEANPTYCKNGFCGPGNVIKKN